MGFHHSISRLPSAVTFSVLCFAIAGNAQVSILSLHLNEFVVAPSTVFDATVSNTGPAVSVVSSGTLSTADGETIARFQSKPYLLSAGTSHLYARDLSMATFEYGSGPAGRDLSLTNRLSAGTHSFCLSIEPAGVGEFQEELCEDVAVDDALSMDPIWPFDKDTIDEVRPGLSWSITSNRLPSRQSARAVLVPLVSGTATRALAIEKPLFMVDNASVPIVPFPLDAASLEPGHCYAWQVERASEGIVIDRTEPWSFCVRKATHPEPIKYVDLKHVVPGAIYEVRDGRIYFMYDEPYAAREMQCRIQDERLEQITPDLTTEGTRDVGVQSKGDKFYELDLTPYHLKKGHYDLVVIDGKGRASSLKFEILP